MVLEKVKDSEQAREGAKGNSILRQWGAFVLVGLVLYLCLYVWSEHLVESYGEKNRFFMINSMPSQHFDVVVLGASHAMPLDFEDMNERLEAASGAKIMNLSTEGAGILPNRLLLDYFLKRHSASHVMMVVDSFAFYSPQWNEERLDDASLRRAPFDPALIRTLWSYPWARRLLPVYVSGFGKINNPDRFAPDIPDAERDFTRTYRPIAQIDRRRVQYLYPENPDPGILAHYGEEFRDLARLVRQHGMELVTVELPTPERYRELLPYEADFEQFLQPLLQEEGIEHYDLSETLPEDDYYYDTDHLNRDGALKVIDEHLAELISAIR
ncbi:hypothetical protein [Chelativorans sp. Marseille-P2723]|uniref:hypothetical protein n=1 Tax=Chelativorans sp. Marseille-P2723 TaxID=2709133 RepID=UPI00156D9BDD|nr:hypothetical protein [Chelativorans sp. Marseille-P2723]